MFLLSRKREQTAYLDKLFLFWKRRHLFLERCCILWRLGFRGRKSISLWPRRISPWWGHEPVFSPVSSGWHGDATGCWQGDRCLNICLGIRFALFLVYFFPRSWDLSRVVSDVIYFRKSRALSVCLHVIGSKSRALFFTRDWFKVTCSVCTWLVQSHVVYLYVTASETDWLYVHFGIWHDLILGLKPQTYACVFVLN